MSKFKWRREPSWWDLEVPDSENNNNLFSWVDSVFPEAEEHDYVLYTDGSGCSSGWGASASVIDRIELNEDGYRVIGTESEVLVSATYGSTVQRRELSAFLDGVHEILRLRAADFISDELEDNFDADRKNILNNFTGSNRVTVLWFTDRMNLAKSLLFDERGDLINARSTEADLWLRWSSMARYVCVTPMCLPRNVDAGQALCDRLCVVARTTLKAQVTALDELTKKYNKEIKWNKQKSQKALF